MPRVTAIRPAPLALGLSALAAAVLLQRRWSERPSPAPRRPVVLITGGAGGLGMALARRYARSNARLILNGRNPERLERARATLLREGHLRSAEDCLLLPANLIHRSEVESMINQAFARFERIDVLINVAGIIEVGPVEDQTIDTFEHVMQANFFSALYTTLYALPRLLGQRPLLPSGRGSSHRASIVNISSIGGKMAVPHLLPYTAAKFALTGFSEGLHAELRAKGVRVTTVCPGLMRTGGEDHATFVGDVEKEKVWFEWSAKTPGISASVDTAAADIFRAEQRGAAEITISPQAWLAARITGLAPGAVATVSSVINSVALPAPLPGSTEPQPA